MKLKKNILLALLLVLLILLMGRVEKVKFLIINKNKQVNENRHKTEEDVKYQQQKLNETDNINDNEQIEKNKNKENVQEQEIISTINLLAVGDIMFHSPQFKSAYNFDQKIYDFSPVFQYVTTYIDKADISIANFETVTAGSDVKYSGFPRFNTPKESLLAIKEAGFDILSTSNNHILDQGKKGLINTIKAIEEYNMKNIGTCIEKEAPVLIEEINGIRLGFLSYTYGLNGMDSTLSSEELLYMVNRIDEGKIKSDIERTKSLDVDLTVIYIHWGDEYHREPSEYQIKLGEKMVNWGANIILGSHPHIIQKSQIINKDGKDNLIVYSMGNFLSNQRETSIGNSYTEDGIMISLKIEKSNLTEKAIIKSSDYIPTWVYRYIENDKLFYKIIPIKDVLDNKIDINVSNSIKNRIRKSFKDTMSKVNGQ